MPSFQQFLTILTTNPGSLAYHVVLAFSVLWALQSAVTLWRTTGIPQGKRMVIGLSMIFVLRLVLFISTGLVWQKVFSLNLLPALDCFINLISLVIIIWLWDFPDPARASDAALGLILILTVTLSALGLIGWSNLSNEMVFYDSQVGFWADIYALILIVFGCVVLVIRRPGGWGYGLAMLCLFSLGYLGNLVFGISGSDYSGLVRLTQMAAYPLLTALPQRFDMVSATLPPHPAAQSRVNLAILESVTSLGYQDSREGIYQAITRTVAQLMPADVCSLVSYYAEQNQLVIENSYNLRSDLHSGSVTLPSDRVPLICNSLKRNKPLRLPASSTVMDLESMSQALGSDKPGHLLATSLGKHGDQAILGLVLLSSVSTRSWTIDDQNYLIQIGHWLAQILQRYKQEGRPVIGTELASSSEASQTQLEQMQIENKTLREELQTTRQQFLAEQLRAESLVALIAAEDVSITLPPGEGAGSIFPEGDVLADMVLNESLLAVPAVSAGSVDWKQAQDLAIKGIQPVPAISDEQAEVIASMAQDLRQPMSSIVGYTDLLLGETVGILGALQRKFLERVKASTERMRGLIDDIIQVASVGNGHSELAPEYVDLNAVIDESVAQTIAQLREKKIALRVDIPDQIPPLMADRDAVQQIFLHLLQNAEAVSPPDGEIILSATVHEGTKEEKNKQDYVLVKVIDSGGGIPAEDLPRVFSRLYRADNPLIQGVGDTGVGLSIVKSLVEAHGGRVWVDTQVGRGSTFSVLLPLVEVAGKEKGAGGQVG